MIPRVIEWCARNRFLVFIGVLFLLLAGIWSLQRVPLDALPDISDVQVIVHTPWPGQPPNLIEDQVTYPIVTTLLAAPHVKAVRATTMFGDSLELTADHLPWWSYVGHFIRVPGYVYAYAFGNLLALSIYQRYKEVGPDFVDTYLGFLAAGGSQAPDQLVRSVGMDITDAGFWDAGLKILDGMVAQVEELGAS